MQIFKQNLTVLTIFSLLQSAHQTSTASGLEEILTTMKESTWFLELFNGNHIGTGFMVTATEQHLITNQHNISTGRSCEPRAMRPATGSRQALPAKKHIEIKFQFPGGEANCNYSRDFVTVQSNTPSQTLRPVARNQHLSLGDKVIVGGFPLVVSPEYRSFVCTFKGFAGNSHDEQFGAYYFHCPTLNLDMGGMSGSPVVSLRTGQVVGLLSAQGIDTTDDGKEVENQDIYATPLFVDTNGALLFGIPDLLENTVCYNQDGEPKDCKIVSGQMQFTKHE